MSQLIDVDFVVVQTAPSVFELFVARSFSTRLECCSMAASYWCSTKRQLIVSKYLWFFCMQLIAVLVVELELPTVFDRRLKVAAEGLCNACRKHYNRFVELGLYKQP